MHSMNIQLARRVQQTVLAVAVASATLDLHAQVLEEVVVTAQHREESLQDVPIAITAIGAEDIRTADVSDINSISLRTPGFSMGAFNPAQPQLFIRGIGSNADGAGEDQSVVVFLDGVYLGRTAGQAFDLFDLERLEVLRGPQGTLYGKNAAGGAINIITTKPSEEFEGGFELSGGDMGYFGVRGMLSGPLGDRMAGKISFSHKERDGYVESIVADIDDLNSYNTDGVRAQLLARPADTLELLLSVDASKDRRDAPGRSIGDGLALGNLVDTYPPELQPDFYENLQDKLPHSDTDTAGISLQADWDLGPGTFTSITAYRTADADVFDPQPPVAFEYFPIVTVDNFFKEDGDQFSQEIRFASQASDSLFWQAGLYYLNEQVDRDEFFDGIIGAPLGGAPTGTTLPRGGNYQTNETESMGAFGQLTWSFGDNWDLTLGGRYTTESKDATNRSLANGVNILEVFDIKADESWDAFTPKVAVNYYLGDTTLYATASTGFKSGGFQGSAPTELAAVTPFDEENVTNYEAGIKGMLLDSSLRFNATVFYTQYEDLQVLIQTVGPGGVPGPNLTQNAGEAESSGFELEMQWQLGSYFQLAGTYAYLDTEYTQLDGNLKPFEGNRLRNAPKNAGSLSLIFDYPLAGGGIIGARADYTHKDKAYQDLENREEGAISSYDVTNLRASYTAEDQSWELAGWVKNVFDEEYMLHNYTINPGVAPMVLPAAPRTVGATLTYWF